MAVAIDFEGRTDLLGAPGCYDLPVAIQATQIDGVAVPEIISAWQLSPEDIEAIQANGGIVFLSLFGRQPPVTISGTCPIRH